MYLLGGTHICWEIYAAFEILVLTWLWEFLSVRRQFIYIHDIELIKIYIYLIREEIIEVNPLVFQKIAGSICWFDSIHFHGLLHYLRNYS